MPNLAIYLAVPSKNSLSPRLEVVYGCDLRLPSGALLLVSAGLGVALQKLREFGMPRFLEQLLFQRDFVIS